MPLLSPSSPLPVWPTADVDRLAPFGATPHSLLDGPPAPRLLGRRWWLRLPFWGLFSTLATSMPPLELESGPRDEPPAASSRSQFDLRCTCSQGTPFEAMSQNLQPVKHTIIP